MSRGRWLLLAVIVAACAAMGWWWWQRTRAADPYVNPNAPADQR
jgi:predicted negative regulator of RcsB-dependent stress response